MRIVSWNVNGLRARLKGGFEDTIKTLNPDILCIQETRAQQFQLPFHLLDEYYSYFSVHAKPGYAGATVFTKEEFSVHEIDFPDNDEAGRVSIIDCGAFKLINAYVPNAGQNLEKLAHRIQWQNKLEKYIRSQIKPLIYCGDLNCAPASLDNGCPNAKAGVSKQERDAYQRVLNLGLIDVFRNLHPTKEDYTWFSNQYNSREANRGMRIDAFIISEQLLPLVNNIEHIKDSQLIAGSDHVPIVLDIDLDI